MVSLRYGPVLSYRPAFRHSWTYVRRARHECGGGSGIDWAYSRSILLSLLGVVYAGALPLSAEPKTDRVTIQCYHLS